MLWLRRCVVLAPVLSFLAAALLLSCGGGSSGGSTSSVPFSLTSVVICAGTPVPPTPTPSPTNKRTPTPTPTAACVPINQASVGIGLGATPVGFNAQGTFVSGSAKNPKFRDITNKSSTAWFDQPPNLVQNLGNGQFQGIAQGCTCIQVGVAAIFSQSVSLTVGSPSPACTPCPQ